ncbi:adenosylcobinamide-GDP ribazoletransferase [Streptacidiphilus jiangxiensis]|uniref:Adenosylcobinamide-GDP ribazoletransferase n=1 Tax=Streptacidiphilus jiangxiensis TaxID=235985 RepID=A0A1H7SUS8_STRJI|nr:adenosylcobinamide-GDP ribazoletransferase [Streptacidiphilus jiangxiensis]SEL76165.1 adenosylcobinamide-GDP ribazoletransferase [Streptacidiphilus jiangxiensis]
MVTRYLKRGLEPLRFAFGTLSVLPVRVNRWDRPTAGRAITLAPVVGLVLGGLAAGFATLLAWAHAGSLLAAVAGVAALAALTRGLHLDGLADVADGLGSNRPPDAALKIMKASDIGPFGVLVLLLTLLAQVAAVARCFDLGLPKGAFALGLAAVTSRAALLRGCADGVPSARAEGLGAMVAGTVPRLRGAMTTLLTVALLALAGWATARLGQDQLPLALGTVVSAAAGLGLAALLLTHCLRRFGGITGDVLGAMVEISATGSLILWTLFAAATP